MTPGTYRRGSCSSAFAFRRAVGSIRLAELDPDTVALAGALYLRLALRPKEGA